MLFGLVVGFIVGVLVCGCGGLLWVLIGWVLFGWVFDGFGWLIDGKGLFIGVVVVSFDYVLLLIMGCDWIDLLFFFGVWVFDIFVSVGCGQWVGFFVGFGVGKFLLLLMIVWGMEVEVIVIVFVGECGCEVWEFIEDDFGLEGFVCLVVVVLIFDQLVMVCICVVYIVMRIVEVFCDDGVYVIFMMDLFICVVMVQCEIGLLVGELLVMWGYLFLMFLLFVGLFECVGIDECGLIIGIYMVFVDGDDYNEFIVDIVCLIFDGYVVFDCVFVLFGYYFVIDVFGFVFCVVGKIIVFECCSCVVMFCVVFVVRCCVNDFIDIGVYQVGVDVCIDVVILYEREISVFFIQFFDEMSFIEELWCWFEGFVLLFGGFL